MSNQIHPEWSQQSSLTAPADIDRTQLRPDPHVVLTKEEIALALKENVVPDFIKKFPALDKYYADPIYSGQIYGLHSFTPAKGATPDKDGVYGMIKSRGTFQSLDELEKREEQIIKDIDSFHKLYVSYVGRPFPLSFNPKYIAETKEVDVKKKVATVESEHLKQIKEAERKEIEEVKERERKLLEEAEKPEDPDEKYTVLQVKRAQLIWTYLETGKKMDKMKESIIKARKEIADMDKESEEYKKGYMEKYMKARRESHLPDSDESFMKYMMADKEPDLGF